MKILLFIGVLFFCSCTMKMPEFIKAHSIVERYLDSVYRFSKVDSLKFSSLMIINDDYFNRQNQRDDKLDPYYKNMADSTKECYRKLRSNLQRNFKGYEIFCTYRVNKVTHTNLFKIDTTFKKVRGVVELSNNPSK